MTETTNSAVEPARNVDPSRQSPGEYLRRLREEKGHTHATVGTALHLTVHYIKALESDEYGKLPGLTFVKGYLRAYARFLGADVDNVIGRFDQHIAGLLDAGMHTARVERSKRRQDQALRWAIGAGFVVVASLAAGWWFMSRSPAAPEAVPAAAPAVVQATPPPSPSPVTATGAVSSPAPASSTMAPQANATSAVGAQNTSQQTPLQALPAQSSLGMTGTGIGAGIAAPSSAAPTGTAPPVLAVGATANTASPVTVPGLNQPPSIAAPPAAAGQGVPVSTAMPGGSRNVSLIASGEDELRVVFNGNSWIEVDDGRKVRLYNDMLRTGDTLTIRGLAPFHVLLGDASNVQMSVNAAAVDISADIRADNTARLVLGAPVPAVDAGTVQDAMPASGATAPVAEQNPATELAPPAGEGAQP